MWVQEGVVKWYSHRLGYGFIKPLTGGRDIHVGLFQVRKIRDSDDCHDFRPMTGLKEGQRIWFTVEENPNWPGRLRATNLGISSVAVEPHPRL